MNPLELIAHDYTAYGIQLGERPPAPPPVALTARDLELQAFVYDFGAAPTSAIADLFWGRYSRPCRRRLAQLHDAGYLDRLRPRLPRHLGSAEWIYRLGSRGWRTLAAHDLAGPQEPSVAHRRRVGAIEHDTQAVQLVVALARRSAISHAHVDQPFIAAAAFTIIGPRTGILEPAAATPPPGGGLDLGRAQPGIVIPDLTLLGRRAAGERISILYEIDRTARPSKQRAKLRRYDHLLAGAWRQVLPIDLPPLTLFVIPAERLVGAYLHAADQELTAATTTADGITRYLGREYIVFTTRARAVAGDWTGWQVPPRPPAARSNSRPAIQQTTYPGPDELFVSRG